MLLFTSVILAHLYFNLKFETQHQITQKGKTANIEPPKNKGKEMR
jgi:hypothetical protein